MLRYSFLDRCLVLWILSGSQARVCKHCSTVRANAAYAGVSNFTVDNIVAQIMSQCIGNCDSEVHEPCMGLTLPSSAVIER